MAIRQYYWRDICQKIDAVQFNEKLHSLLVLGKPQLYIQEQPIHNIPFRLAVLLNSVKIIPCNQWPMDVNVHEMQFFINVNSQCYGGTNETGFKLIQDTPISIMVMVPATYLKSNDVYEALCRHPELKIVNDATIRNLYGPIFNDFLEEEMARRKYELPEKAGVLQYG